jgi:periplasmic protein TonB
MAQAISSNYGHFDDLVFQTRNQKYGAYQIRKSYAINGLIGFGFALFVVLLLIVGPMISNWIKSMQPKEAPIVEKKVEVTLKNTESIDEEEKEEIKEFKKQEAPQMESVKFTVPIVTTEDVEEVTTQEDLTASNPGSVTQQGLDGFSGLPDGEGTEEVIGGTNTDEVFTVVEQMPEFPGGEAAMNEFLDKNLQYPTMAKEQGIQGKVWIGFIVDKFGNVSNVEVLRGIGGGCDEEAARVVSIMPRWVPGKQSGRPVIVKFRFPINFTLR